MKKTQTKTHTTHTNTHTNENKTIKQSHSSIDQEEQKIVFFSFSLFFSEEKPHKIKQKNEYIDCRNSNYNIYNFTEMKYFQNILHPK